MDFIPIYVCGCDIDFVSVCVSMRSSLCALVLCVWVGVYVCPARACSQAPVCLCVVLRYRCGPFSVLLLPRSAR